MNAIKLGVIMDLGAASYRANSPRLDSIKTLNSTTDLILSCDMISANHIAVFWFCSQVSLRNMPPTQHVHTILTPTLSYK